MSVTVRPSYLRFKFIDPANISAEACETPLLEVGVFIPDDYTVLSAFIADPRALAVRLSDLIGGSQLEHSAEGRLMLQISNTPVRNVIELYYCIHCGGRLETDHCSICGREYLQGSILGRWHVQPDLPIQIAQYVVGNKVGHRFSH